MSHLPLKNSTETFQTPFKITFRNCSDKYRCNNPKECKRCRTKWRNYHFAKALNHLTENHINQYEFKYSITITSSQLKEDFYKVNITTDDFIKEFKEKKRNDNFVINDNSQYVITKEISYSKQFNYNPHYNIILLTNKEYEPHNKQLLKLQEKYKIDIYIEDIYKTDNSYKTSIEKLFNYMCKFENSKANLERDLKIGKGKRDIFTTDLFNKKSIDFKRLNRKVLLTKYSKLQRSLYIHIANTKILIIKHQFKQKRKIAKAIYKKQPKKTSKSYIRFNKSLLKKLKLYKKQERTKISRLEGVKIRFFSIQYRQT